MAGINDLINIVLSPTQTSPSSGLTNAAVQSFLINTLPVLQNEAQLRGQQDSLGFVDVVGRSLATALPQFIQADVQDQRVGQGLASNLLLQGTGLQQSAAGLSAQIADQQRQRQLESSIASGTLLNQFTSGTLLPAAAQQTQTAFTGLEGLASIGGQQQATQQARFNAEDAERARLQGLSQQAAFSDPGIGQFISQTVSGK